MAGYVMKMSILVSNINQCGQKDLSFKVRHKAYASRYAQCRKNKKIKNILKTK
jgi:hypothetical protein